MCWNLVKKKQLVCLFKETGGGGCVPGILTELYEAAKGLKGVQTLIKIILTYPVTSAEAERSLSGIEGKIHCFRTIIN